MHKFRRRAYVKALNTVKRRACDGEKVIIVKPIYTSEYNGYLIGDIFEVKDSFSGSVTTTVGIRLYNAEYRVLLDSI